MSSCHRRSAIQVIQPWMGDRLMGLCSSSKETAEQLLVSGVVSHREELIQCIAPRTHYAIMNDVNAPRAGPVGPLQGAKVAAQDV
jgi:hypothetical protein